jgi:hypothetical protein
MGWIHENGNPSFSQTIPREQGGEREQPLREMRIF